MNAFSSSNISVRNLSSPFVRADIALYLLQAEAGCEVKGNTSYVMFSGSFGLFGM